MGKKLRFGFVGCGTIANSKHMPWISRQPEAELTAFCDIDRAKAEKAAKEFGTQDAKVFTDYRELLKDESIDVVHVLVPNRMHCEITVAAFEAGKHVLCEKPIAANTEDAMKMIDAWKKTDRKFTIGYQWRFRPETLYVYDMCEKNELGEIYYAKAQSLRRRGVLTYGSYLSMEAQGGGALIDIGSHSLDLTLWLINNYVPESLSGSAFQKLKYKPEGNPNGRWDPEEFTVEESGFAHIKMENGALITLEAAWLLNIAEDTCHMATLCGTKGGVDLLQRRVRHVKIENDELVNTHPVVPGADPEKWSPKFQGEYEARHWVRSIINDTEPLVSPYEALVVAKIIDAVYESAKTGKTVYFNKAEFHDLNQKIQCARNLRKRKE